MELTVQALAAELGLELLSGEGSARARVRWVHATELEDPTPWLRGGELLLSTGLQLGAAKAQREWIDRLCEHHIAGLGFGTGFRFKRVPPPLLAQARKREFPLFEVPYELPFIAITERVFAQLLDERYELLQRSMAGDVLAEAMTGRLYPEELQAKLRPFGIGSNAAVLAFSLPEPAASASVLEHLLALEGVGSLVAMRSGLLCAVIDADGADPFELAKRAKVELASRSRGEVRAAVSRPGPSQSLRLSFHEARCALEAVRIRNGASPEVASYRDLGAFQLLLTLQDEDALRSYCRGVLGALEEGENEYGEELLRSLDLFIENNGHWERAASALFCHRHTLRYRMKKVEQLTGRDLSSARDRIEFWLALRGRELTR